jgi:hypothetical protein
VSSLRDGELQLAHDLAQSSQTNWEAAGVANELSASSYEHREPCLAPLADLLHARVVVDALLSRCLIPHREPAANEESCHATDPGLSRTSPPHAHQPPNQQLDAKTRAEALDILARIIAQVTSSSFPKRAATSA